MKIRKWKVVFGVMFIGYFVIVGFLEYGEAQSRASRSYVTPFQAGDSPSRPIYEVGQIRVPYLREDWDHWQDFDADCQNTRAELLLLKSLSEVTFTDENNCRVYTGEWLGPYTGNLFTRASDVDIDHVIPLKYAHDHGGASWSRLLKMVFSNDPENLLVTEDNANQSKSDAGPSGYEPREEYHCEYGKKWRFLSRKYELSLSKEDQDWVDNVLQGCT